MITSILFYIFSGILILAAIGVVSAKNPVHAVLYLVFSFVISAMLWLMLNIEFLALSLIVIYVGAVMVLFLFVVMMLEIDKMALRSNFWKNLPLSIIIGLIVLAEIVLVLLKNPIVIPTVINNTNNIGNNPAYQNANHLGFILYTQYSYPVEIASIILLLGLVIAVALTLRRNNDKQAKYQDVASQVKVSSNTDRLELIKDLAADSKVFNKQNHK